MHYNLKFPREMGNPKRKVARNMTQLLDFINANNGVSNLYLSVYNFLEFRKPWMHPIYESAIIDRIYFDFDQKIKENGEWVSQPAYENMLKLHEWCMKHDYIHFPRFTGSGYDTIVLTNSNTFIKNKQVCVWDAVLWLSKKLNFQVDPQVKDVLPRIYRIENSFNIKETARRFCIPLNKDIIYLGEEKIREIAMKQRFTNNSYGTKFWNIVDFDAEFSQFDDFLPMMDFNIDEKNFAELSEKIPDCVKAILSRKDLGWEERRIVVLALRDNCYLLDETISILRKHLSAKKFTHCMRDERQPSYLYKKDNYMFPHQEKLLEIKACPCPLNQFCEKAKSGCLMYGRDKWLT